MNIIIRTDGASPLADLSWILEGLRARGVRVTEDRGGNLLATLNPAPTAAHQRDPGERISAAIRAKQRTWPPRRTDAGGA